MSLLVGYFICCYLWHVLSLCLFHSLRISLAPVCYLFFCVCRKCCPGQQYSIKCHKIKAMRRCLLCNCAICQAIQTHTHHIRGILGRVLILKFIWSCSLLLCISNVIISLTYHLHLLIINTLHKSQINVQFKLIYNVYFYVNMAIIMISK